MDPSAASPERRHRLRHLRQVPLGGADRARMGHCRRGGSRPDSRAGDRGGRVAQGRAALGPDACDGRLRRGTKRSLPAWRHSRSSCSTRSAVAHSDGGPTPSPSRRPVVGRLAEMVMFSIHLGEPAATLRDQRRRSAACCPRLPGALNHSPAASTTHPSGHWSKTFRAR